MFRKKISTYRKSRKKNPREEVNSLRYKAWRTSVYTRDSFTCQKCLKSGGYLEAHHILNWEDNISKRYLVDNGITFCKRCHFEFHKRYGKSNTTKMQLKAFLST